MITAFNGYLDQLLKLTGPETELYGVAVSAFTTVPTSSKPELTTLTAVTNGTLPVGDQNNPNTSFDIAAINDSNNSVTLNFVYNGSVVGSYTAFVIGYTQSALLFSVNSVYNTPDTLANVAAEVTVLSLTPLANGTTLNFATNGSYGITTTYSPTNTVTVTDQATAPSALPGYYNVEAINTTFANEIVSVAAGYQEASITGANPVTLVNANGGDLLVGGGGSATLISVSSGDTLQAGSGDTDLVSFYGPALETAAGQGGEDLFVGGASPVSMVGGSGYDVMILANGGAVTTGGGGGQVWLGAGQATVNSNGSDIVVGGSGSETINATGSSGMYAFGGSGKMVFTGGSGASTVVGLNASVTVTGGSGGGLFFGGTAGNNIVNGGSGPATLVGGGNGDVLTAKGNASNVLTASSGAETLTAAGSTGSDQFFGGAGSDCIVGGAGSNVFTAGPGNMTLVGGGSSDLFIFLAGATSTTVIDGFNPARDHIRLIGFASGASQSALAGLTNSSGGPVMTLPDGTKITFAGVSGSSLTSSSFG